MRSKKDKPNDTTQDKDLRSVEFYANTPDIQRHGEILTDYKDTSQQYGPSNPSVDESEVNKSQCARRDETNHMPTEEKDQFHCATGFQIYNDNQDETFERQQGNSELLQLDFSTLSDDMNADNVGYSGSVIRTRTPNGEHTIAQSKKIKTAEKDVLVETQNNQTTAATTNFPVPAEWLDDPYDSSDSESEQMVDYTEEQRKRYEDFEKGLSILQASMETKKIDDYDSCGYRPLFAIYEDEEEGIGSENNVAINERKTGETAENRKAIEIYRAAHMGVDACVNAEANNDNAQHVSEMPMKSTRVQYHSKITMEVTNCKYSSEVPVNTTRGRHASENAVEFTRGQYACEISREDTGGQNAKETARKATRGKYSYEIRMEDIRGQYNLASENAKEAIRGQFSNEYDYEIHTVEKLHERVAMGRATDKCDDSVDNDTIVNESVQTSDILKKKANTWDATVNNSPPPRDTCDASIVDKALGESKTECKKSRVPIRCTGPTWINMLGKSRVSPIKPTQGSRIPIKVQTGCVRTTRSDNSVSEAHVTEISPRTNRSGSCIPVRRDGNIWRAMHGKSEALPIKTNPGSKLPIRIQIGGDRMTMDNSYARHMSNIEQSADETKRNSRESHDASVSQNRNMWQAKQRKSEASPITHTPGSKLPVRVTASDHDPDKASAIMKSSTPNSSSTSKLPSRNVDNAWGPKQEYKEQRRNMTPLNSVAISIHSDKRVQPPDKPAERLNARMDNKNADTTHHRVRESPNISPVENEYSIMLNGKAETANHRDRASPSHSPTEHESTRMLNRRAETSHNRDRASPSHSPIEHESTRMLNRRAETSHRRDRVSPSHSPVENKSTRMINKRHTSHHRNRGSQSPSLIETESKRMLNQKVDNSYHKFRESPNLNPIDYEHTRMANKGVDTSNYRTRESPDLSPKNYDSARMMERSRFPPIENRNYSPNDDNKCFWKISTRPPSRSNQPNMILSHSSCETDFFVPQPMKTKGRVKSAAPRSRFPPVRNMGKPRNIVSQICDEDDQLLIGRDHQVLAERSTMSPTTGHVDIPEQPRPKSAQQGTLKLPPIQNSGRNSRPSSGSSFEKLPPIRFER